MTMYVDVIISRYNEDLAWTLKHPFNLFKYIVYNKGTNDNFEKSMVKKIINLPNVGRCDHTYLYHIINNYDSLAEINVFFPGSINMEQKLRKASIILNYILKHKKSLFIGFKCNIYEKFKDFYLNDWESSDKKNLEMNTETKLLKSNIRPYGEWYNAIFGKNHLNGWITFLGIFSIDKRDILKRRKEQYEVILKMISTHSNPEIGHYIERSWGVIFYPLANTTKMRIGGIS